MTQELTLACGDVLEVKIPDQPSITIKVRPGTREVVPGGKKLVYITHVFADGQLIHAQFSPREV